jgi:hypothetical protein
LDAQPAEASSTTVGVGATHNAREVEVMEKVTNKDHKDHKNNQVGQTPQSLEDLSTVQLVKDITSEVAHLTRKQFELARTELRAELKAEAITVGGLGIAALAGLATVNLLLVTAVFALAQSMSGWLAGLMVSALTLVIGGIVAVLAWNRRVRSPLARTRRTLTEDIQWSKERLV